jgi:ATP-dependent RNA helicase DeaD
VRVIEDVIQKKFERGTLPDPQEICAKQLYRVIDQLEHVEVDENQIAPFLPEVFRKLDWLSKEDVIKRLVSQSFGHFLAYYKNAPVIEQPSEKAEKQKATEGKQRPSRSREKGPRKAEDGYVRLFINFGKRDNFYAREIINLVSRYVKGVEIGRIDLTASCSFFEVPERYGDIVLKKMRNAKVGDRPVVVDSAERTPDEVKRDKANRRTDEPARPNRREIIREARAARREGRPEPQVANFEKKSKKGKKQATAPAPERPKKKGKKDDWRQFFE